MHTVLLMGMDWEAFYLHAQYHVFSSLNGRTDEQWIQGRWDKTIYLCFLPETNTGAGRSSPLYHILTRTVALSYNTASSRRSWRKAHCVLKCSIVYKSTVILDNTGRALVQCAPVVVVFMLPTAWHWFSSCVSGENLMSARPMLVEFLLVNAVWARGCLS